MNILRPKACRRYEEGGVENTLYLIPWTRSQSPINVLRPGACWECVENGVTKPDIYFLFLGDKVQCMSEQYHGVENCRAPQAAHVFFYFSDKKGNFHFHISDIINIKSSSFPGGLALGNTFLKFIFFIESSRKMIQFKIQFKTKSKIFIQ